MCQRYSFAVSVLDPRLVYATDWESHSEIEASYGLTPGDYREVEWTAEGEAYLTVRGESVAEGLSLKAAILARYSTLAVMLAAVVGPKVRYSTAMAEANRVYDAELVEPFRFYSAAMAEAERVYDAKLAAARRVYNAELVA